MAESFVEVNPATLPGKKLATYEFVNTNADVVESEAVTPTDSAGNEIVVATEATVSAIAIFAASIDSKIKPPSGTGTLTAIPAANVPTPFLLADSTRLGFSIFNDSSTDTLYLLLSAGGPVSVTLFSVALQPKAYFENPFDYRGVVTGIWGSVGVGAQALVNVYKV